MDKNGKLDCIDMDLVAREYYSYCEGKLKTQAKRIKELENLLGGLYDEAAYEKAGEWVLENKELQKKVKQILKM